MTRYEFMKELEGLLSDIPLEDRKEALQYYNDYFDDAGQEHEEKILKELGSPMKVAAIITADLNSNLSGREDRGVFTEKGYQDTVYEEEKFEIVETPKKIPEEFIDIEWKAEEDSNSNRSYGYNNQNLNNQSYSSQSNSNQNYNDQNYGNGNQYYGNGNQNYGKGNQGNGDQSYSGRSNTNQQPYRSKGVNIILILLLIFFAIPVGLPLILSVLGTLIALIVSVAAVFLAIGITGIALIGAGIALFIGGILKLWTPLIGLLMCGAGLVVFGIGMLFTIVCGFLSGKLIPAMVRGFVYLCRLPFRNRRAVA